ncbi:MAG: RlpA-like double-psi beta-barrel domain-containing protein [Candidatus Uhrbacteria bacterium]|nr:RlpA-like double-psi beta-barrel domain-containing protein [Candidatus Uhrbacteria bacterium]
MKRALGAFLAGLVLLFAPHARGEEISRCPKVEWHDVRDVAITATHTVRRGENLTAIARRYGDSVADLARRNGINQKRKHLIEIGEQFTVHIRPTVAKVSWYGPRFHGRLMSNRDVYDMHDPETVAHKKLPFGTKVLFRNPQNGKVIETEVRDRGPYVKGREFDLSYAAAHELGIKEKGVARLEYLIACLPQN